MVDFPTFVRDPIHGEIRISSELIPILSHPFIQRLRRVKQLGLADIVYPSAVHTRFAHSLGVYHITGAATDDLAAHVYALVHDVAHGPLSHLIEYALRRNGIPFDHDERMKALLPEILEDTVFSPREVLRSDARIYVSGGAGSDRLDYLLRDAYFSGVAVGEIAWDRIVRNVWVERGRLVARQKIIPNLEQLFIARFILGDALYFHKTVLIADEMFVRAVSDLLEHYTPDEIVMMDDSQLDAALNSVGSVWWERIRNRQLFKLVHRSADREDAVSRYDHYVSQFGEDRVIFGERLNWYKPPQVVIEDHGDIRGVSPLVAALEAAERRRHYYFVAVDPNVLRSA